MVILVEDSTASRQVPTKQRSVRSRSTRNPATAKTRKNVDRRAASSILTEDSGLNNSSLYATDLSSILESTDSLVDAVREHLSRISIDERSREPDDENYEEARNERRGSSSALSTAKVAAYDERNELQVPGKGVLFGEKPKPRAARRQKDNTKTYQTYVDDQQQKTYVQSILNEGISTRSSRGIQQFDKWADRAVGFFDVRKIAEGSYGEVYELCAKAGVSKASFSSVRASKLQAYMDGVFKIVPLRAQRGPGSKKFTTVDELVAEVQLLKLLDPIPGFARFREIHVVQGRFPPSYQDAWDKYSKTKDDCFNPDPSKKKSYPDNQLWAILEMENAGFELEKFKLSSMFQVYDIFWGVALALARAEQYASFEHRDLHPGNVCVKQKRPPQGAPREANILEAIPEYPVSACLGASGLETTIIDYSLSRAELPNYESPDFDPTDQRVAWSDLEKKEIFDAIGRDEDEKYLRDTYRLMRSEIFAAPYDTGEEWKSYRPKTNLVWLSFILTTLLKKWRIENPPSQRQPLRQRSGNSNIKPEDIKSHTKTSPKNIKKNWDCERSKIGEEIQQILFERLETVQDLLELEDEYENMSCAGDLVAIAIGSQWLAESDFLC